MAGDWIKMRNNLDTDPRVFAVGEALGLEDLHVVGLLWKVWSWADQHTIDGNAVSVTASRLDRIVGVTGFTEQLRKVGWLEGRDSALSFPRFAEHNGKTAKTRAQTSDRVKRNRNAVSVTEALPEKRREEKKKKTTSSKKFDALGITIPDALDTSEFREAWGEWVSFRREKKNALVESTAMKQIAKLAKAGSEAAVAMIDQSIEKGWTGLFEIKGNSGGRSKGSTDRPESALEREQRKLEEFNAKYHAGSE